MAALTYLDFDLLIERAGDRFLARVLNSPSGQASTEFLLPFTHEQLQIFVLKAIGLGSRRRVRRIESPEMKEIKGFGRDLFEAVFDREVNTCLRRSLDEADRRRAGLRIRLRLDDPDGRSGVTLFDVPWEFMYDSGGVGFLCLSSTSPLVRYPDLPRPVQSLAVVPPLRLLVMISSPRDAPHLDVEHEGAKVEEALRTPIGKGLITIDRLETATLEQLQRRLRTSEYHVFHFIGHGGYDERGEEGVLLLEDDDGKSDPVSGEFLRTLFQNHRTLRLAILNACEGARTDPTDPFAGVAQSLVRGGVSAVIAMQFEISDEAAIMLSAEFYSALADGYPVDAALAEARTAVYTRVNAVEWAVPVLYLRSPDGSIFEVAPQPAAEPARPLPRPPSEGPPEAPPSERTRTPDATVSPDRGVETPAPSASADPSAHVKAGTAAGAPAGRPSTHEARPARTRVAEAPDRAVVRPARRHRPRRRRARLAVVAAVAVGGGAIVGAISLLGPTSLRGSVVYVHEGDVRVVDPETREDRLLVEGESSEFAPSISADGAHVLFGGGPDADVFAVDADGSGLTDLTEDPATEDSPDWSPDGSRIAFESDRDGDFEIYVMDADGSNVVQLTDDPGSDLRPDWSPDGSRIAFQSDRDGDPDVYVMGADRSNVVQLTDAVGDDGAPIWSPDGEEILFRSEREGVEVWVMTSGGSDERALTHDRANEPVNERGPAWSPDGTQIVFASDQDGDFDLYVIDAEGGDPARLTDRPGDELGPTW